MGLRASRLNYEKIQILEPVISRNEFGEQVQTYQLKKTTKALVEFIDGKDEITNQNAVNSYSVKITIRSYNQVNDNDLILWNDNKYNIDYIKFDRSKMIKEIKCNRILE